MVVVLEGEGPSEDRPGSVALEAEEAAVLSIFHGELCLRSSLSVDRDSSSEMMEQLYVRCEAQQRVALEPHHD